MQFWLSAISKVKIFQSSLDSNLSSLRIWNLVKFFPGNSTTTLWRQQSKMSENAWQIIEIKLSLIYEALKRIDRTKSKNFSEQAANKCSVHLGAANVLLVLRHAAFIGSFRLFVWANTFIWERYDKTKLHRAQNVIFHQRLPIQRNVHLKDCRIFRLQIQKMFTNYPWVLKVEIFPDWNL